MHKVLGGLGRKEFELQDLQHVVIISQPKKKKKVGLLPTSDYQNQLLFLFLFGMIHYWLHMPKIGSRVQIIQSGNTLKHTHTHTMTRFQVKNFPAYPSSNPQFKQQNKKLSNTNVDHD